MVVMMMMVSTVKVYALKYMITCCVIFHLILYISRDL